METKKEITDEMTEETARASPKAEIEYMKPGTASAHIEVAKEAPIEMPEPPREKAKAKPHKKQKHRKHSRSRSRGKSKKSRLDKLSEDTGERFAKMAEDTGKRTRRIYGPYF